MGVDQKHLPIGQQQSVHAGIGADAFAQTNHLIDVVQMRVRRGPGAADQAIDFTFVEHHRANQRKAATHINFCQLRRHTLASGELVVGLPKVLVAVVIFHVDHCVVHTFCQAQAKTLNALRDDGGATN